MLVKFTILCNNLMMLETNLQIDTVIALCGPSGVGKGFTKKLIQSTISPYASLREPVVCTTRPSRPDDNVSRRTGIHDSDFDKLIKSGSIVLSHRPFRNADTPRYGFASDSVRPGRPLLTEVHSSIYLISANIFRPTDLSHRSMCSRCNSKSESSTKKCRTCSSVRQWPEDRYGNPGSR